MNNSLICKLSMLGLVGLLMLSGCGSGSVTSAQPATAVIKISTVSGDAIPSNSQIDAIDVTLNLPAGVTIKTKPASDNPLVLEPVDGAVTASGAALTGNSVYTAVYTAAVPTNTAKIRVAILNVNGFNVGEFATITCDITSGHFPSAAGFSLSDFKVYGTAATTVSPTFTVEIR